MRRIVEGVKTVLMVTGILGILFAGAALDLLPSLISIVAGSALCGISAFIEYLEGDWYYPTDEVEDLLG